MGTTKDRAMASPIAYEYHAAAKALVVRPRGDLTASMIKGYFEELIDDPMVGPVEVEIVEFECVTDFVFAYSDTSAIRLLHRKLRERKGIMLTIFHAPPDLHYGMARMLSMVLGEESPSVVLRATEDYDQAIDEAGLQSLLDHQVLRELLRQLGEV